MEENIEMENTQNEEKIEILTEDLGQFLNYTDREKDGRQDGYFMHQSEYLSKKKVGFVSRFHKLIENRIDELKEEKLKCETLLINLTGQESTFVQKLKFRLELCNEYISNLENEKILSMDYDGLVKSVIVPYEVGYDLGMNDYLNDQVFFESN